MLSLGSTATAFLLIRTRLVWEFILASIIGNLSRRRSARVVTRHATIATPAIILPRNDNCNELSQIFASYFTISSRSCENVYESDRGRDKYEILSLENVSSVTGSRFFHIIPFINVSKIFRLLTYIYLTCYTYTYGWFVKRKLIRASSTSQTNEEKNGNNGEIDYKSQMCITI